MNHAIKQQQAEILQKIYSVPPVTEDRKIDGMLCAFANCKSEIADWFNKSLGLRIREFVKLIDLDHPHPDLFSIGNGILSNCTEESINHLITDLVVLADFSIGTPTSRPWHSSISKAMAESARNHVDYEKLKKLIGDPLRDLMNIRLYASESERNTRRGCKIEYKASSVGWNSEEPTWSSAETTFDRYYFGVNDFENDLNKAKARRDQFKSLGLSNIADYVQRDINDMIDNVETMRYCGFNKISVRSAVMTLAKICRFDYSGCSLRIPKDGYPAFHGQRVHVVYKPIRSANVIPNMKRLVDFLEKFPGLDGHPVFDNYLVLLPVLDGATNDVLFKDNYIIGVLVGERQGDYYFISYWMSEDQ